MSDRSDVLDVVVTLHQRKVGTVVWEDVTRGELDAILDHVKELNQHGTKIESFSIEHHVSVPDWVKEFGE